MSRLLWLCPLSVRCLLVFPLTFETTVVVVDIVVEVIDDVVLVVVVLVFVAHHPASGSAMKRG